MRISDWSSDVCSSDLFDHLGIACAELARGQRREGGGVDQDECGLVEGADQILARGDVDRGLAADATVDLREQGRRHLDEDAAALDDAACEADEIADHPAAERDDMVAALDSLADQPLDRKSTRLNSSH